MHGLIDFRNVKLFTNAERFNDIAIPFDVLVFQIIQQVPTPTHQLEQTATRVMIFRVGFKVLGEIRDSVAEKRDLHFRRTGIVLVRTVIADNPLFYLGVQCHFLFFLVLFCPFFAIWQGVINAP